MAEAIRQKESNPEFDFLKFDKCRKSCYYYVGVMVPRLIMLNIRASFQLVKFVLPTLLIILAFIVRDYHMFRFYDN